MIEAQTVNWRSHILLIQLMGSYTSCLFRLGNFWLIQSISTPAAEAVIKQTGKSDICDFQHACKSIVIRQPSTTVWLSNKLFWYV